MGFDEPQTWVFALHRGRFADVLRLLADNAARGTRTGQIGSEGRNDAAAHRDQLSQPASLSALVREAFSRGSFSGERQRERRKEEIVPAVAHGFARLREWRQYLSIGDVQVRVHRASWAAASPGLFLLALLGVDSIGNATYSMDDLASSVLASYPGDIRGSIIDALVRRALLTYHASRGHPDELDRQYDELATTLNNDRNDVVLFEGFARAIQSRRPIADKAQSNVGSDADDGQGSHAASATASSTQTSRGAYEEPKAVGVWIVDSDGSSASHE